jgi:apolipoprotein N-acyltransferase
VIDAKGELVASLPWRTAGVIDTTLPAPKPPTLFARFGNILPAAFGLVLLLVGLLQRRGKQARGAGI